MIGNIIAVDPGVDYFAAARFGGGGMALRNVWLLPIGCSCPFWADQLVIEKPRFRPQGRERKEDVMDLGISAGRIAEKFQCKSEVWVDPVTWKGTLSKAIHHPRILRALSETELAVLCGHSKGDLKHIMDAVGLGLWHLRRMG